MANLVVGGGNSLIKGFDDRISKELINLETEEMNINIISNKDFRGFSVYNGLYILS